MVLAVLDVVLATGVFTIWAQPHVAESVAAGLLGWRDAWDQGTMDPRHKQVLARLSRWVRGVGLVLVTLLSFVTGAVVVLGRL